MNWKTVRHLIDVDRKSGRLLRGQRLIKYDVRRSNFFSYLFYGLAIGIGLTAGLVAIYIVNLLPMDLNAQALINEYYPSLLVAFPTMVLIITLVFTMLQQIQRSGVRFNRQVPYWLPVTWEEHTLASILAELLGFPLTSIALISSAVLVFSVFAGHILLTVGSILAMVGAAFMASATTEIFRVLQLRFVGAVYKSSGRAAVWVRFAGSLLFFIVFYAIYFSIVGGGNSLIILQTIAASQNAVWYVPFVWLGLILFSLTSAQWLQGVIFLVGSLLFIAGLYLLATVLNKRYGLYEPPAITISHGVYAPKTGFLGKIGLSSVQAALIGKDLKAFTRRRELMGIFILPIVFLIVPIMTSLNVSESPQGPPGFTLFWFVYMTLFPTTILAMSLGSFMTGEEGQSVWRIFMSPISASDFVKSKYAFMMSFSLVILAITTPVGFVFFHPSIKAVIVLVLVSIFVAFPVGALSLANGIKGADFNEVPRPRMIRPNWAIVGLLTGGAVALVLLLPFLPYIISIFTNGLVDPFIDLYVATAISGVVSAVLTVVFYKMAVGNAAELLSKAEL
ncbi:MAG TPA: hypothetical protein VF893_02275 [Candidatus Bathyarchaeia archaeon]